jgi:hypothetical protein
LTEDVIVVGQMGGEKGSEALKGRISYPPFAISGLVL